MLVGSNLLPLFCVLLLGWDVFPLLVLFWLENVIIGALNAARMLLNAPADPAIWAAKLFMVPFFCVHYGMFTLGHGVFVLSGMFGGKSYEPRGLDLGAPALAVVRDFGLWLPLAALAASHVFSFFWNYLLRGEYQRTMLATLMMRPYKRVVALHVTLLVGALAISALGSPVWALVVLIAVKIGIDVYAHRQEHRISA